MRFVRQGDVNQVGRLEKFFQLVKRIYIPFFGKTLGTFAAGVIDILNVETAYKFCFGNKPVGDSPVADYAHAQNIVARFPQRRAGNIFLPKLWRTAKADNVPREKDRRCRK